MTADLGDIAAMRKDGDLLDFVRSLTAQPATKPLVEPEPEPEVEIPRARPGAWPDGTRSPGLLPEVARALDAHWPGRFDNPDTTRR